MKNLPAIGFKVIPSSSELGFEFSPLKVGRAHSIYQPVVDQLNNARLDTVVIETKLAGNGIPMIRKLARKVGFSVDAMPHNGKLYLRFGAILSRDVKPAVRLVQNAGGDRSQISVSDAIRMAIAESPRTTNEICDRVLVLAPQSKRPTVSALILQREKAGEFVRKGLHWFGSDSAA